MIIQIQRNPGTCRFKKCWERPKYENGERTREQETNANGVPLWNIRAELFQDGEDVDAIIVAVPMERNPAEGLQYNEEIVFKELVVISGARSVGGGRWERLQAASVVRRKRGAANNE